MRLRRVLILAKKIAVVTGFVGFIGCTFTEKLLEKGWYVYAIDKFCYLSNHMLIFCHNMIAFRLSKIGKILAFSIFILLISISYVYTGYIWGTIYTNIA